MTFWFPTWISTNKFVISVFNVENVWKVLGMAWNRKTVLFSCPFPNTCPFQTFFYLSTDFYLFFSNVYLQFLGNETLCFVCYFSYAYSLYTYKRFIFGFFSLEWTQYLMGSLIWSKKKYIILDLGIRQRTWLLILCFWQSIRTPCCCREKQFDLDLFLFWFFF